MAKRKEYKLDDPIFHTDHARPRTRREFLSQGFHAGVGSVMGAGLLGSMFHAGKAHGVLSEDIVNRIEECQISGSSRKIPFICFDLAGGANIAGSNVLVGGPGGQLDFLSTAGYSKQGVPGDMLPAMSNADAEQPNDFINQELGLAFHSDSQFLAGILEKTAPETRANINGSVIAARSENDTANNPHNPMYAINLAGAQGELLSLIGSRASDSGGNSLAPAQLINPEVRPTKIDRASDVTGLVSVGDFGDFTDQQIVDVMEYVSRLSDSKIGKLSTGFEAMQDEDIKEKLRCKYVRSAQLADDYPPSTDLSPLADPDIVGANGIFSVEEMNDREFQKTASVMKLVLDSPGDTSYPFAGAGTISMGGYDYHTGDRRTGEQRDLRAGRCMGACLEYARRKGRPLMMYVYSDGSVFSNGMTDDSAEGRGKGVWTGDNQQTAAAFFLVYDPNGQPQLTSEDMQQIGYMRPSGDVETSSHPAANNVNQLVQMVMLNYMALHGDQGRFTGLFEENGLVQGLGSASSLDQYIAFQPITTATNEEGEGVISNS